MKRRFPLDSVFFSLKIPIFILGNLILNLEIMAEGKEEKEGNKNHRYRPTYRPQTAGRNTLWFVLDHSLVRAT